MKISILTLFLLLILSCKSDNNRNPIEMHFADAYINQDIKNSEAKKKYENGIRLLNNQKLKEAKKTFNQALKIEKNSNIYNALGTVFLNENNENLALIYFQKAIDNDAEFWPGYIAKTRTLISISEYDKAKNSLKPILKNTNSKYWISYANFYLAVISINTGENCDTIKRQLKKSEFLKTDIYLNEYYEKVSYKIQKHCS